MSICSLDDLKTYIGTSQTGDNALWTRIIYAVQDYIEGPAGLRRWTEPHIETRYYRDDVIDDDNLLCLGQDLLAVTTLTNGDTTAILAANYWMLPRNVYPKWMIELKAGYDWEFDTDGEITLAATWGWHTDYGNAWLDSLDTVENATGLTATGTSITVNNSANFKVLQLIKIGSEFMLITAAASNTLTVKRARNGSTGATHDKEDPIYIWTPMQDTIENAIELAQFVYKRRDTSTYDITAVPELGTITIPKGMPAGVDLWLKANRAWWRP